MCGHLVIACVVACVCGCGRVSFDALDARATIDATADDARPDVVLANHDEDGDGIDDAQDSCPQLAMTTADADGDGIGDACDPFPSDNTEKVLVWSTLRPGDHPFEPFTSITQEADALLIDLDNASLTIAMSIVNARIELGFEIRGIRGTGQHQVASGLEGVTPFYFVQLNDNGPLLDAGIWSYDATNGYLELDARRHSGLHTGRGVLQYDVVTGPTPRFTAVTGWLGELYMATAATSGYGGGDAIRFTFNGVQVALEYVRIVASN